MGAHLSQHAHIPTAEDPADHPFVCSAKTARYFHLNQTVVSSHTKEAVGRLMCKSTHWSSCLDCRRVRAWAARRCVRWWIVCSWNVSRDVVGMSSWGCISLSHMIKSSCTGEEASVHAAPNSWLRYPSSKVTWGDLGRTFVWLKVKGGDLMWDATWWGPKY